MIQVSGRPVAASFPHWVTYHPRVTVRGYSASRTNPSRFSRPSAISNSCPSARRGLLRVRRNVRREAGADLDRHRRREIAHVRRPTHTTWWARPRMLMNIAGRMQVLGVRVEAVHIAELSIGLSRTTRGTRHEHRDAFRSRNQGGRLRDEFCAAPSASRSIGSAPQAKSIDLLGAWTMARPRRTVRSHTNLHLDFYLGQFCANATARGAKVHFAADAAEARDQVTELVKRPGPTSRQIQVHASEEIGINGGSAKRAVEVVETDLGEWIVHLATKTAVSHHPSGEFTRGAPDIQSLFENEAPKARARTAVLAGYARRRLRKKFEEAGRRYHRLQLSRGRNRQHRSLHQRGQRSM